MRYRRFGNSAFTTSEIGFGCARIGGLFQGASRSDIISLLRRANDRGITFFDTADMYTQGESERLVGQAFSKRRHQVLIATKFGYQLPRQKQLVSRVKPLVKPLIARLGLTSARVHARLRGTVQQQNFSPAFIVQALEASLQRLKTDYVDVYQLHDPPLEVLERGEFVATLENLRQQGKIRCWGVAGQEPRHALAALAYPPTGSIQVGLSVLEQAALDKAIPSAAQRGVAVIARQVFASGLLTRPVQQLERSDIDQDPVVAEQKRSQLAVYATIAQERGRSRSEMALQFSLARPEVAVVLVGISRSDQLDTVLAQVESAPLSDDERELLLACRRSGP